MPDEDRRVRARRQRLPHLVVLGRVSGATSRGAAVWGAVFGLVVFSSVLGFTSTYTTPAQRQRLAATVGTNRGVQALFGPTHHIDQVAGFTAWRSLGLSALIGAVWALLAATKQLRGEEEAGRWELVLAGQTTRRRAAAQAVGGLGVALLVLWTVTSAIIVAVGRSSDARFSVSSSLFFGLGLVSAAMMFLAIGALTSQLAATRRQAAGLASAVLGAAFVLRLAADAGTGLRWARWVSPLGWVDELRPLTGTHLVALVPIFTLTAGVALAAVFLAGERDVGASTLPDRAHAPARTRLLRNQLTLSVRLARNTAISWAVGVGAAAFIIGLVAKSAGESLGSSITRFGVQQGGAVGYLGLAFVIVAALVAVAAAGQVAATRDEEGEGHLDNLLARPVARLPWLAGRLAIATSVLLALGVAAGLFAWIGAASQDSGVGFPRLLAAGVATVPAAVFVLGIGTLAHSVAPRYAAAVAYAIVAGSFLLELVGSVVNANGWLLDLSVFHHLSPAPAADPNWTGSLALAGLGILAAAIGAVAFERRDLIGA